MQPQSEYPISEWNVTHQELMGKETWRLVQVWHNAREQIVNAFPIREAWERWYRNRSAQVPDLIDFGALYGYSRLLIQGWQQLPIEIPANQADTWREWGLGTSLSEFREHQAGIAGGFLELAGHDPELTRNTLEAQLEEKLAELKRLLDKSLEEYTPQKFTEKELDESDWLLESDQRDRLDEPFKLYEQLICFDYGLQKLRIFCVTEEDEELSLPNKALYEALLRIDLSQVWSQLDVAEPKLRRILQHLMKHHYFELNSDIAPESFWWRHWQQKARDRKRE